MRKPTASIFYGFSFVVWAVAVGIGAVLMWHYESAAGAPAEAPPGWPAAAQIERHPGMPNLVVLIHPHCPCSRATIGELAELMTDCQGKLATTVLMIAPAGVPDSWVHTDLWSLAAAIPGVTVVADRDGTEALRFGAATSGQALLYAADGKLLFAGGITESRGHSGDNAGRSAIAALVLGNASVPRTAVHTPVYGCALFDVPSASYKGNPACRR